MVNDKCFPVVFGKAAFGLLITIAIFGMFICAYTCMIYFNVMADYRQYMIFGLIGFSMIYLIMIISFIAARGTAAYREKMVLVMEKFMIDDKDKHIIKKEVDALKWFYENHYSLTERALKDEIWNYVDDRTEDVGSIMTGAMIVWMLFDGLLLYLLIAQNDNISILKGAETIESQIYEQTLTPGN